MDLDVELPAIALGDADAFARWLAGAERPLRQSLRRFAAAVDTEAVMQEALLRVWVVARRCRPDGKPNSLLRLGLRIARNLALGEIRRTRSAPIDDGAVDPPDPPAPEPALPDPALRRRIEECLEKLPRKPAAALAARIESAGAEPDRRLADRLGMRLNTFLQNITRARRLLAGCLQRLGIEIA
jgi:DNA-directed RNA polymerase specialized sigma24 family protein